MLELTKMFPTELEKDKKSKESWKLSIISPFFADISTAVVDQNLKLRILPRRHR